MCQGKFMVYMLKPSSLLIMSSHPIPRSYKNKTFDGPYVVPMCKPPRPTMVTLGGGFFIGDGIVMTNSPSMNLNGG